MTEQLWNKRKRGGRAIKEDEGATLEQEEERRKTYTRKGVQPLDLILSIVNHLPEFINASQSITCFKYKENFYPIKNTKYDYLIHLKISNISY